MSGWTLELRVSQSVRTTVAMRNASAKESVLLASSSTESAASSESNRTQRAFARLASALLGYCTGDAWRASLVGQDRALWRGLVHFRRLENGLGRVVRILQEQDSESVPVK